MMTALQHQETLDKTTKVSRESHATQSYPSRTIVHAKLEMTEPGDHDELEAEEMANAIVSGGKISRKISGGASGSSGIAVSQQMERQLAHLQSGGRQMPEGLRNMMENGFGRDFSQVRLHTDSEAAEMSSSIHAKAFTHGNDIYFNRGQFAPETSEGQHLVAHELTHVVQGTGKVGREEEKDMSSTQQLLVCDSSYVIQNDLATYDSIMQKLLTIINNTDLTLGLYYDYEYDEEFGTSLINVGGNGVIVHNNEIERIQNQHKREVFMGTWNNMREGLLGSVIPGTAMLLGEDDPEKLYAYSELGAAIDSSATALYGEHRAKNRLPNPSSPVNVELNVKTRNARSPEKEFISRQNQALTKQNIANLRAKNEVLRKVYQQFNQNRSELSLDKTPENIVLNLIHRYERIIKEFPTFNENPSSSELFHEVNNQLTLLHTQLEIIRNEKEIQSLNQSLAE